MDAGHAVGAATVLVTGADRGDQHLIVDGTGTERSLTPRIVARAGHPQHPAQDLHRIGGLLRIDEPKPAHRASFAKKAAAFLGFPVPSRGWHFHGASASVRRVPWSSDHPTDRCLIAYQPAPPNSARSDHRCPGHGQFGRSTCHAVEPDPPHRLYSSPSTGCFFPSDTFFQKCSVSTKADQVQCNCVSVQLSLPFERKEGLYYHWTNMWIFATSRGTPICSHSGTIALCTARLWEESKNIYSIQNASVLGIVLSHIDDLL